MTSPPRTVPLICADLPSLDQVADPFREILKSGQVTNYGKYVTQFEEEASAYLGTHVATTSSGTMALIFALQALGLKPGEKVILPSFTFMATAQAVCYAGGTPVFTEIDEELNISCNDLADLLARTRDARFVIPVHMYGLPAPVEQIERIVEHASRERSTPIHVLYDAAHAFGSMRHGRRVGSFGNAEAFSLSVTKALVAVEGGLVSSRDPKVIERVRRMRNYGIEKAYDAHWAGLNGKMSEFHAIIGLFNLRRLEEVLTERQRKSAYFRKALERTRFRSIPCPADVQHTYKDFTVFLPESLLGRRDALIAFLRDCGVETRAYFSPPVHEQAHFKKYADRSLPRTEALARRVLTLPFYTSITEPDMDYVVETLLEAEQRLS